jgi:hypothetical protein
MKHSLLVTLLLTTVAVGQTSAPKAVLLDDLTILEGTVENFDGVVRVTPAAGTAKILTLKQIAFVGASRDAVYEFVAGKVDTTTADGLRKLAGWCEKVGMTDRALTHAKAGVALAPTDATFREMVTRLEKATVKKPAADAKVKQAAATEKPVVIPTEVGIAFNAKVQPVLMNQCASCHAAKNYDGGFKLTRIPEGYANPEATAANLTATAAQISREDPAKSPLLLYTLTAHGGQKRAAFADRQQPAVQNLEAWVRFVQPTTAATAKPSGFGVAPSTPPAEPEPAALPGAVVGATGQPVAAKPLTPAPAPPAVKPPVAPDAADPFDPRRFNGLPKKGEK